MNELITKRSIAHNQNYFYPDPSFKICKMYGSSKRKKQIQVVYLCAIVFILTQKNLEAIKMSANFIIKNTQTHTQN